MKKAFLLIAILGIFTTAQAQVTVNGVDINKEDIEYINLTAVCKGFGCTKLVVSIDYGQKVKFGQTQTIKDAEGKTKTFNSEVDALNFMSKNGWVFVNSYPVTIGGSNIYKYLMKRKNK